MKIKSTCFLILSIFISFICSCSKVAKINIIEPISPPNISHAPTEYIYIFPRLILENDSETNAVINHIADRFIDKYNNIKWSRTFSDSYITQFQKTIHLQHKTSDFDSRRIKEAKSHLINDSGYTDSFKMYLSAKRDYLISYRKEKNRFLYYYPLNFDNPALRPAPDKLTKTLDYYLFSKPEIHRDAVLFLESFENSSSNLLTRELKIIYNLDHLKLHSYLPAINTIWNDNAWIDWAFVSESDHSTCYSAQLFSLRILRNWVNHSIVVSNQYETLPGLKSPWQNDIYPSKYVTKLVLVKNLKKAQPSACQLTGENKYFYSKNHQNYINFATQQTVTTPLLFMLETSSIWKINE